MVTVVQGKVCAKNHPDRLSRLATVHQRYRQTDGRTDFLWHRPRPNGRPKMTRWLNFIVIINFRQDLQGFILLRDMALLTVREKSFSTTARSTFPLYRMHCRTMAGIFQCNAAHWHMCSLSHFYLATCMHSADYAVAGCLSIRLSVTHRYCV